MKITPIEIRKKEFEKAFRGYEKEAVDAYLQSLSTEWERLLDDNKAITKSLEAAEKEVQRLREVESSLFRTLKSAEETGNTLIEAANKKAELYLREAQMNAESMLTEARYKAKSMLEDAEEKTKDVTSDLHHDIKELEQKYNYFVEMKENMIREVKSVIMDFNDKLSRHSERNDNKAFEAKVKEAKNQMNVERPSHSAVYEPKEFKEISSEKSTSEPDANNDTKKEGSFFDSI